MTRVFRGFFWVGAFTVTTLSLLSSDYLPPSAFDWWDKAQHALAFLVLGGFGLLGYSLATTRVVIGLLLYGAAIEVAQSATGWRYGDWQDWLADAVGCGSAYLGWYLWKLTRSQAKFSSPNNSMSSELTSTTGHVRSE